MQRDGGSEPNHADVGGHGGEPGGEAPVGSGASRSVGGRGVDFGPVPTSIHVSEDPPPGGAGGASASTPIDGGSVVDPGGCEPWGMHGVEVTTLETVLTEFGEPAAELSIGEALALDGDTLAVGAFRNSDRTPHGFVFVFVRVGRTWSLETTLEPPPGEPDNWFGKSIALEGDTLAVGAPESFFVTDGPSHGRIHVFERAAGAWRLSTTLTSEHPESRDDFGDVIALSGRTLVTNASSDLDGRVEVFDETGVGWKHTETLAPWQTTPKSAVFDLAIDGDRLAVGVLPGVDNPGQAVHVFERREGHWIRTAELKGDHPAELFGASVAIDENTLVVGDPYQGSNDNSPEALLSIGAAYVFERDCNGVWNQQAFLKSRFSGVAFGGTVAIDQGRLVISDRQDHQHASGIDGAIGERTFDDAYGGAVYVFDRAGPDYGIFDYIKPRDIVLREKYFGSDIAADGGHVIVGSRGEGAAYIFF